MGEAYGTHMEIHMEIIFPCLMLLTSIWNHMEAIWKSQTKKNVTRLVLGAYGTHMEIHMEIIFPSLMSLTSIWNHMEVIWKSYGSPKQKKMLLGSFLKHIEPIRKSQTKKNVTRLVLEAYGTHTEI